MIRWDGTMLTDTRAPRSLHLTSSPTSVVSTGLLSADDDATIYIRWKPLRARDFLRQLSFRTCRNHLPPRLLQERNLERQPRGSRRIAVVSGTLSSLPTAHLRRRSPWVRGLTVPEDEANLSESPNKQSKSRTISE